MRPTEILAIDPGNVESGYVVMDYETYRPNKFGKINNEDLLDQIVSGKFALRRTFIERIASYGMPVGEDVFVTCFWIGRFQQAVVQTGEEIPVLAKRLPIKTHICKSAKATDANVKQALVDRFATGEKNYGKGTKSDPGWFYGFRADIWQAYALGVYAVDLMKSGEIE